MKYIADCVNWITGALMIIAMLISGASMAAFETYEFSSSENSTRYFHMSKELRCPTCQNQNISDSDAPLAADLRRELHRMIESDYQDEEILDFMVSRYGDFIHYKPRITPQTYVLWYGPYVVLLFGFLVLIYLVRKNRSAQNQRQSHLDQSTTSQSIENLTGQHTTQDELSSEQREKLSKLLQQDSTS